MFATPRQPSPGGSLATACPPGSRAGRCRHRSSRAANPLGTRWLGLSAKGYGIHGTNEPRSIGKAASHGCIRMAKADLEELFNNVQVGDVVEIRAQRDAETAAIFGSSVLVIAANATGNFAIGGGQ